MILWTTPKTDWTASSYFNAVDYNRIKNNLIVLSDLVNAVYPALSIADMGSDKTVSDFMYADEFNLFETNLETMKNWIVDLGIGRSTLYSENAPMPNYTELNRIESAMLKMHDNLIGQINGRPTLAFTLNGGVFE